MSETNPDKQPLKVLHIGKYFPPHRGGMETVLRDQMNIQTRDEGLRVAAVVHSSERRLTDKVEIQPLGYHVRLAARWFTAAYNPISPLFLLSVIREIKLCRPSEIVIHLPNLSAFWLLIVPMIRDIPWVIYWHSDVLVDRLKLINKVFFKTYKTFETLILERAEKVIVTSPPYRDSSESLKPFLSKCIVRPVELDKARFANVLGKSTVISRLASKPPSILCVGRLTYYKDFGTAIRATSMIEGAQLRIVGDGDESQNLHRLINSLDLQKRVAMLGEISDTELWRQYEWCDVLCLPSIERTEAFGVVILEAAAFNRPSVVADTEGSGMSWIVQHIEPRGDVFKASNPADLKAKIERICKSNSEHQ